MDSSNVDDELVQSIEYPARDPNAPEVFYRLGQVHIQRGAVVAIYFDISNHAMECHVLSCQGDQ